MTTLLELRDKFKIIYSKNEVFILPVVKFLLAFIVLLVINGNMGYMTRIDNVGIVLVAALTCSFLPVGGITLFAMLFSLLHMYALSLEVAIVGIFVYLLLFLLFFRFGPKDALVVVLTPLLCFMKVPYIMPLAMGLLGTPASAVSVGCGVVVYYLLQVIISSAGTINTMGSAEAIAKVRLVLDGLMDNKAMLVMVIAFAITVIVVYIVRRMSIDYSWTIAMVAGAFLNMVILLIGDLIYETNISVLGAIFGNLLALVVAKVIEFFRFCVDYSRTEKVQFEDDEYYYYVKAVPKMTVAATTKTVKHINTQRRMPASSVERTSQGRSVTTERTHRRPADRYDHSVSGRSVTIGSQQEEFQEDYEELF